MIAGGRRPAHQTSAIARRVAVMVALCASPAAADAGATRDAASTLDARRQTRIQFLRARIAKLDNEIRRLQLKRGSRVEQALLGGLITDAAMMTRDQHASHERSEDNRVEQNSSNRALERALVKQGGALLPKGVTEFTAALGAQFWDKNRPVSERDAQTAAASVSIGIAPGWQASLAMPWQRSHASAATNFGFGELGVSIAKQLLEEDGVTPNLIANAGIGLKSDTFGLKPLTLYRGNVSSIYGGLSATKRFDPVVLFGNVFVSREGAHHVDNAMEQSGLVTGIRTGGLLALSPRMSLSGAIAIWNTGERRRDDAPVRGSGFLASEISVGLNTILTPSLMLNISVSSRVLGPGPDLAISASLPYRF